VHARLPAVQGIDHQVVDEQHQGIEAPSGDVGLAVEVEAVEPEVADPLAARAPIGISTSRRRGPRRAASSTRASSELRRGSKPASRR
jgi:hypothetical protein